MNDKGEVIASRITNASKSPDKYVVGNSLVISLNDSVTSPGNKKDGKNIYATQYAVRKTSGGPNVTIFPSTTTATTNNSEFTEKRFFKGE